MKTKEDFNNFYNSKLKMFCGKETLHIKIKFVLGILIMVFGISIINYIDSNYINVVLKLPSNLLTLVALLFFSCVLIKNGKGLVKEYKMTLIDVLVKYIGNNGTDAGLNENGQIARDVLCESGIFNLSNMRYSGKNYTVLRENKMGIALSDVRLWNWRTDKKRSKEIIFDGVYMSASFNKPIRDQVYVVPNNFNDIMLKKMQQYISYNGVRVFLENNEFEEKYNVYSENEIEARYILSLRLMERINDIDKIYSGKKYIVFKKESGRVAIFFESNSLENIKNMRIPVFFRGNENELLNKIFEQFNKYIEVYKILDLDNKLYLQNI